jgi:hypothetical protein
MKRAEIYDDFTKQTAEHRMEVLRDDGLFRHLSFKRNGSYCMSFDIITWPGYLCFCGDMGCYVFSRIRDMFEFFRGEPGRINPPYWAEKLQAQDKHSPPKEFSRELFKTAVVEYVRRHFEDGDKRAQLQCFREVRGEILEQHFDHEVDAYRSVLDFDPTDRWRSLFQDFWETDCTDYTFRYIWCLYAIVWGIGQYDMVKGGSA